jgi:hypothetical protein
MEYKNGRMKRMKKEHNDKKKMNTSKNKGLKNVRVCSFAFERVILKAI